MMQNIVNTKISEFQYLLPQFNILSQPVLADVDAIKL
jgi:hypothetical protein